jgi:hypothetical protein
MSAIVFNIIYLVALLVISGINVKSYIETKEFKINFTFVLLLCSLSHLIGRYFNLNLPSLENVNEIFILIYLTQLINALFLMWATIVESKIYKITCWIYIGLEVLILSTQIINNI